MINRIGSSLICTTLLFLASCSKDKDEYKTFVFKTIDLVANTPIDNVKIRFGIEVGCSKLLDSKEVFTNKDGNVTVDLDINQDTIDAYYKLFPVGQQYLNNSIEVIKDGYGINQFFQDTGIVYTLRPIFAENNLITAYMYRQIPFSVDFKNTKTNLSDKFLDVIINCYPKHPLLDSKLPEYKGSFLLDRDPKDFVYQGHLAAISYDIEVIIVQKGEPDIIVYEQIIPITIDQNSPSNNIIQINY